MSRWRDAKYEPTVTCHPVTGWQFHQEQHMSDAQATERVVCPCCKGAKKQELHDGEQVIILPCIYCEERGWMPSEVAEPNVRSVPRY